MLKLTRALTLTLSNTHITHSLCTLSTLGADPEELAMLKRALREEAEKSEELRRALSGEYSDYSDYPSAWILPLGLCILHE